MLNLLSPALFTNHRGQSKADAPSNRIWSKVKGETVSPDGTASARGIVSNFQGGGVSVTAGTGVTPEGYKVFGGSGSGGVSQADGSGLLLTVAGTNIEANVISGGGVGGLSTLSLDSTLAFETDVKLTPGSATNLGLLAGVIEPATTGAGVLINTTCLPKAAADYVGFIVKADNTIAFGYKTSADATPSFVSGVSQAITSGSSYKLGFLIDSNSKDELLKVFINGVQVGQKTRAELLADAKWPDDTNFAAIVAAQAVSGSSTVGVRFAHCVQVS